MIVITDKDSMIEITDKDAFNRIVSSSNQYATELRSASNSVIMVCDTLIGSFSGNDMDSIISVLNTIKYNFQNASESVKSDISFLQNTLKGYIKQENEISHNVRQAI